MISNPALDGCTVFGIGRGAVNSVEGTVAKISGGNAQGKALSGPADASFPRWHPKHPLFAFAAFLATGLGLVAYSTERVGVSAKAEAGGVSAGGDLGIGG